jgi:hypothetical protein
VVPLILRNVLPRLQRKTPALTPILIGRRSPHPKPIDPARVVAQRVAAARPAGPGLSATGRGHRQGSGGDPGRRSARRSGFQPQNHVEGSRPVPFFADRHGT